MTEFYFYQLSAQSPQEAIAQLCERAIAAPWTVSIRTSDAFYQDVSQALWTTNPQSFLAHDIAPDPRSASIHISSAPPSGAQCCFTYGLFDIFEGAGDDLARHCILFSSAQEDHLAHARQNWKNVTARGFVAKYFSQETGSWALKAQSSAP
jgi:DNA polymerase-3 subunit chi